MGYLNFGSFGAKQSFLKLLLGKQSAVEILAFNCLVGCVAGVAVEKPWWFYSLQVLSEA